MSRMTKKYSKDAQSFLPIKELLEHISQLSNGHPGTLTAPLDPLSYADISVASIFLYLASYMLMSAFEGSRKLTQ